MQLFLHPPPATPRIAAGEIVFSHNNKNTGAGDFFHYSCGKSNLQNLDEDIGRVSQSLGVGKQWGWTDDIIEKFSKTTEGAALSEMNGHPVVVVQDWIGNIPGIGHHHDWAKESFVNDAADGITNTARPHYYTTYYTFPKENPASIPSIDTIKQWAREDTEKQIRHFYQHQGADTKKTDFQYPDEPFPSINREYTPTIDQHTGEWKTQLEALENKTKFTRFSESNGKVTLHDYPRKPRESEEFNSDAKPIFSEAESRPNATENSKVKLPETAASAENTERGFFRKMFFTEGEKFRFGAVTGVTAAVLAAGVGLYMLNKPKNNEAATWTGKEDNRRQSGLAQAVPQR